MRIGIVGAFSTGKTTLAQNIYNKLQDKDGVILDINTERKVAEKMKFNFNSATEKQIRKYQQELFDTVINIHTAVDKLVTDTPLILQAGYALDENIIKNSIKTSANLYDILLYIPAEANPLVDDGIRHNNENFRQEVDNKLYEALKEILDINPKLYIRSITGITPEDKLAEAMYLINDFIKGQKHFEFVKEFMNF